jgi:LDH2 family malate/lactate/ureidoglycolate dehydrogenase
MITQLLADEGVRLPGARRVQAAAQARENGIQLSDTVYGELTALAK